MTAMEYGALGIDGPKLGYQRKAMNDNEITKQDITASFEYIRSTFFPRRIMSVQPQSHDSGEFNGTPVDLYEQRIYWGSNGMTLTRYQLYQSIDSPYIYSKKINILAESGWPNNYENRGNHTTSKGIVDGMESMITIFDKNLTIAYFPIRTDIHEMLQVRIDDTKENAQKILDSLTVRKG